WCTEQGKDAITGRLGDVAAVALHRLHHHFECRVDDGTGFFWVEVLDQLHRSLDVGEQRGDRLALTIHRRIRRFCAQVYRRASGSTALRFAASTIERLRTFKAELRGWWILCFAGRTSARERRRAFHAEFRPVGIFSSALRAARHCYATPWLTG